MIELRVVNVKPEPDVAEPFLFDRERVLPRGHFEVRLR
jgi:hypothetical protein